MLGDKHASSHSEQRITTATKMSRCNPIYQFIIIKKKTFSHLLHASKLCTDVIGSVKANSMQAYYILHDIYIKCM